MSNLTSPWTEQSERCAAGFGKTSIALHRVAYLLYKHRDSISADDILIISPNKVFAQVKVKPG